jgi:hypothetical protein
MQKRKIAIRIMASALRTWKSVLFSAKKEIASSVPWVRK